ncbi:MAG TPA: hypothetical protein VIV56_07500 [Gemmatimonadales bacterium]
MIEVIQAVVLVCDIAGCDSVYVAESNELGSALAQRTAAARHGWRFTGAHDVCPPHERPFVFRKPVVIRD